MGDRCRSSHRCVGVTSDGPALCRENSICVGCVVSIQKRLEELPFLAAALRTMKGGFGGTDYEAKVNASREPGAPLNLTVMSLLQDIDTAQEMTGGYQIRDLIMQSPREYMVWLREVLQPMELDGVDRALRVLRVHQRASNAVGLAPVRDRRVAPCPGCDNQSLGQWCGTDTIDCDTEDCGMKITQDTYEAWCMELSRKKK